jgi:hypothetical protein
MAKTAEVEETPMRSQMWKHEDFVEWATEEGLLGSDADQATTIAVFAANRNKYRATSRYRDLVESHREEAETAKKEAAAARKAKAAAEKAEKPVAKKAAAKKTVAKKTTARTGSKAKASAEDNPFDE